MHIYNIFFFIHKNAIETKGIIRNGSSVARGGSQVGARSRGAGLGGALTTLFAGI